jgi:hypothetical protein
MEEIRDSGEPERSCKTVKNLESGHRPTVLDVIQMLVGDVGFQSERLLRPSSFFLVDRMS